MFCAPVHPGPLAGGEAPEGDKAGGGSFVEGTVGVVGGEALVVEGFRGGASGDRGGAFVELKLDGAGYGLLGLVDEGVEGGFEGGEPEAVVGEFGVALLGGSFKAEHVLGEGEGFELSVGPDDGEGGGGFVDLATLYTHEAVFDHVHAPHSVLSGDGVELGDQADQRQLLAVEARREALFEAELDVPW